MKKNQRTGIPAIHERILRKQGYKDEPLIQSHIDLYSEYGKTVFAEIKAKRARVEGKAIRIFPAKAKAMAVYSELEKRLGKEPPFKVFEAELWKQYPNEPWPPRKSRGGKPETKPATPWVHDTINDWWRAMKAGRSF